MRGLREVPGCFRGDDPVDPGILLSESQPPSGDANAGARAVGGALALLQKPNFQFGGRPIRRRMDKCWPKNWPKREGRSGECIFYSPPLGRIDMPAVGIVIVT